MDNYMVIFVKKMTTTHEVLMNTAKINKFVNNCTDKHGFFLCYATPVGVKKGSVNLSIAAGGE